MKRYLKLFLLFFVLSCNNERTLILPEIESAEITEVLDVSAAYIFYDESQSDSTLLNRKNLISTTNWLVNVDKRLSLKQALTHIIFLQEKKRNAQMHKNENAKNYFTCNNKETKTLGFLEFTDIYFKDENPNYLKYSKNNPNDYLHVKIEEDKKIRLISVTQDFKTEVSEGYYFNDSENFLDKLQAAKTKNLILFFDYDLSFQDYIDVKHFFSLPMNSDFEISENEYLFP
jgi:hypothetical protein